MVFPHATKKSFSFDGVHDYFFWVEGDSKKPAILLITGFTGTHSDLLPLARFLKRDFFVIIPDLPGWGKSPRFVGKMTLNHYAVFLEKLLEHLDIVRTHILGHCMGATLALQFALHYEQHVNNLILVSLPYTEGTIGNRLFLHLADVSVRLPSYIRPLLYLWRNRLTGSILSFFVLKFKSFRKILRITKKNALNVRLQPEYVVEESWFSFIHFNYEKAKRLKIPIIIIHGEKDVLVSYRQIQKFHALVPKATLITIPQAGHLPPVETPETLASVVISYVKHHENTSGKI